MPETLDDRRSTNGRSPAPDAPAVIDALTGVRAIAAVFVLLFHFRQPLFALLPALHVFDPWMRLGFLSIDVFFVLSGFIISHNYAHRLAQPDRAGVRDYLVARIARMYPVHLVMTLVAAALVGYYALQGLVLNPVVERTVPGLIGNFFLLQSFPGVQAWNGPSWTVSSEMVAYLLFPLFAWLIVRLRRTTALALLVVIIGAELAVIGVLSPYAELFPFNWVRLAGGFVVGCLGWAAWRHGVRPHWRWDMVAFGCVVAVFVSPYVGSAWLTIPFLAVFVLVTASVNGPMRAFLASPLVVWGGKLSYSIYLAHSPVIIVMYLLLPPDEFADAPVATRTAVVLAYLVAIVLVAAVLHYLVEEPARRWIRRRASGPRLPAITAAAKSASSDAPGVATRG